MDTLPPPALVQHVHYVTIAAKNEHSPRNDTATYYVCSPPFDRKATAKRGDLKAAVVPRAYWEKLK